MQDRIAIHRSYQREVACPVQHLDDVDVETIDSLKYGDHEYPLFCLRFPAVVSRPDERLNVLISAGVHGDEPAGVFAVLDFLRGPARQFADRFRFFVFPCVNPSGFEATTLETMNGKNLNRLFGTGAEQAEVRAIESWLAKSALQLRLTLDLHEAPPYYVGEGFDKKDNPDGTYLYETVTDGSPRIGRAMIERLPAGIDVCDWPKIYSDVNQGGVISYPEACGNPIYAQQTSLDAYLNGRRTGHSFTTETPTFWSMEKRVAVQLSYLKTALELVASEVSVASAASAK